MKAIIKKKCLIIFIDLFHIFVLYSDQPRQPDRQWGRPSVSSTLSHEFFDVQDFDTSGPVIAFFTKSLI
jgi:hypothetical protein